MEQLTRLTHAFHRRVESLRRLGHQVVIISRRRRFSHGEVDADCTLKGRCKVGWIVRSGSRESWDVWLEVRTGLVKRIARVNA